MSALGQKQTCAAQKVMSALPPKADMCSALAHVRFVPIGGHCARSRDVRFTPQTDIKADIGFVSYFIRSIASLAFLFPSSSHLLISSVIFDCARLSSLIFSQSGGMP